MVTHLPLPRLWSDGAPSWSSCLTPLDFPQVIHWTTQAVLPLCSPQNVCSVQALAVLSESAYPESFPTHLKGQLFVVVSRPGNTVRSGSQNGYQRCGHSPLRWQLRSLSSMKSGCHSREAEAGLG